MIQAEGEHKHSCVFQGSLGWEDMGGLYCVKCDSGQVAMVRHCVNIVIVHTSLMEGWREAGLRATGPGGRGIKLVGLDERWTQGSSE